MSPKVLTHPATGKTYALGRRKPAHPPRLHLHKYFRDAGAPPSPSSIDYSGKAEGILDEMLGNDTVGDCTKAAAVHVNGMLIANANAPVPANFNAASTLASYYKLTGGKDTGLNEQVVLDAWRANGLFDDGAHKIAGYLGVNGGDLAQLQFAAWAFGNLYIALAMPAKWTNPMPSPAFVWGVAGSGKDGHAFCCTGYNMGGLLIEPWGGLPGTMTFAAAAKYLDGNNGQAYVVLSQDAIDQATEKAPSGFDFDQLSADLAADFGG